VPFDPDPSTFIDVFRARSATEPGRSAYIFLADGEEEADRLSYGELDRWAVRIAALLLAEGAALGERALLLFPPGLEFAAAFLGCLYAGVVAVPAYPPRPGRKAERLTAIATDAQPRFALTAPAITARWAMLASECDALRAARCLELPARGEADSVELPRIGRETLAFLQYTSGSTSAPKGVEIRHRHLLFMERVIGETFEQGPESVVVGWLPLYHDMGLIGNLLQPLYAGGHCVLMSPVAFLRRPRRWLAAITRYRATTSGGPSFAYELCAERIGVGEREGLDLGSWRVAFNGAEPVRAGTMARFAAAFAPYGFRRDAFQPCYGLAEATLLVSGVRGGAGPRVMSVAARALERGRIVEAAPEGERGDAERTLDLVGCGAVPAGQKVEIVDPVTLRRMGPDEVGEIWVAGPGVASGYWGRPEETARDFGARRADAAAAGPFLRTGDLGFVADGELFVTGRLKDLIILRGRNHYPQDVEHTVERSAPELAPGSGAAFSVEMEGEERLVVAQELRPRTRPAGLDPETIERLAAAVRRSVAEEHEAQVHEVVLLAPGALPKTSSGKVRRQECRRLYLAGALAAVGRSRLDTAVSGEPEVGSSELANELRLRAAATLGIAPGKLGLDRPLLDCGLDSLAAIELAHGVERDFGAVLPLEAIFDGASCNRLAEMLLIPPSPGGREGMGEGGQGGEGLPWTGLSYGERGLWLLDRVLPPEDAAYRLAAAARLSGPVSAPALRVAFQDLMDRHEALRTTYREDAVTGEPVRQVAETAKVAFAERDATSWTAKRLTQEIEDEAWRPFDLARGPLLRVALLTGRPEGAMLVISVHHIVADFASLALLARQLGAHLPENTAYSAFARRQAVALAGPRGDELWAWWRACLEGMHASAGMPYDRAPEAGERLSGPAGSVRIDLGRERTERLLELARSHGVTPYSALLAVYTALLGRLFCVTEVTVGTPAAGRPAGWPEAAETVGYFANPLALRCDLGGDPAFTVHLARSQERLAGALAHQEMPFPLLVERLRQERPGEEIEPFRTMLTLYRAPAGLDGLVSLALGEEGEPLHLGLFDLTPLPLAPRSSQFDLTLSLGLRQGSLGGLLVYHAGRFEAVTIQRLAEQLGTLLDGALEQPAGRLSELPLLSAAARHQIVVEANDRAEDVLSWHALEEGFERQARVTPQKTAIVCGRERTTYEELNRRATRLARHLLKLGVGVEDRVAVLLGRTTEMVTALLAVLKAGAAYVPLDPAHSEERLAFLLADSGASLLLTREDLLAARSTSPPAPLPSPVHPPPGEGGNLTEHTARRHVLLDVDAAAIEGEKSEDLPRSGDRRGTLAYVIYTSGSTGNPKGVGIEHRSALRLIGWAGQAFGAGELAGVLAATSIGFDLSVFEIFAPLSFGGTVILAESVLALPELPAAHEVTLLNTVPSAMAALLDLLDRDGLPPRLAAVTLAGEPLRRSLAERLLGAGVPRLLNLYGPTEDTTYSTGWLMEAEETAEPPIGRPLAGSRAYVLDADLHLLPPGAPGELCLGGFGLARGYLGRPELTAERWIPDPWGGEAGGRLYRTGDRARQRADGALVYLGRLDRQLKMRGFRIEPAEVEAALLAQPWVREAAVVRRSGQGALAAYVVVDEGASVTAEAELLEVLARRLPAPLVPSAVTRLDALPLTPNGKVDHKALEALTAEEGPAGAISPPRGEVEERLAAIWVELLGPGAAARIGRESRFFDLGGHSLLAARLVARVRRSSGVELPLAAVFEAPRLIDQARRIEDGRRSGAAPIPRSTECAQSLSFAQERLWFLDQLAPGRAAYNMPVALWLNGRLSVPALAGALATITRRHAALRTTFAVSDGSPYAVVRPAAEGFPLPVVDLEALTPGPSPSSPRPFPGRGETRRSIEEALAAAEAARPFDLARGPLFRAVLVRLLPEFSPLPAGGGREMGEGLGVRAQAGPTSPGPREQHLLVLVLHHILADGWSLDVLARELGAIYTAAVRLQAPSLPQLPIQYADYAAWQRAALTPEAIAPEVAAWTERLAGLPPALALPGDRPRPPVQSFCGGTTTHAIPGSLRAALGMLGAHSGATPFMVWFAGFAALLSRLTGEADLAIGTAVANRTRVETEGLIGLFVNSLVVRADLTGDPSFSVLLGRVRASALWAFAHQDLPFEKLVEALAPVRALSHAPLFQAMLVAEIAPPELALPGLAVRRQELSTGTAKLDLLFTLRAEALHLEHNRDLFDRPTVLRLLSHLTALVAAAAVSPERRLSELPFLSAAESQQLLVEWNAAPLPAGGGATLPERFAAQALRTPEAVALVHGSQRITYVELARRSRSIAEQLTGAGVGPEVRVGVLLPRTPGMVAALLGVLAAGGAYVPLDPRQPPARLLWTLEDSGASLLLSERDLLASLGQESGGWEGRTVLIDEDGLLRPEVGTPGSVFSPSERHHHPTHLAYVIYTSGSTGRPKGVAIEHRSAAALLDWGTARFSPAELAGVLAATSIAFDLSVFEIFLPLTTGGRVILARDALELPELAAASQVTLVNTVPSAMAEILRLGGLPASVRTVNLAGEPLPALLAKETYDLPHISRVWNLYGPSEDTTYSTAALVARGGGPPPIGRPLPGKHARVLDAALRPVPAGVPGELFLGGPGLARGYLGRPDLTAFRFIPDPWGEPGSRLYRTGDLARFRPGGELDFLGRRDQQVKVRGFRIELGEIEVVLAEHPAVQAAAVLAIERPAGTRLAACWAPRRPEGDVEAGDLRAFLRERLPEPMVPAAFLRLAVLPLTPNGKVDRKALAEELSRAADSPAPADAPLTLVEERIAGIWREVLERREVDPAASFFEIGGHSLLATRVLSRLRAVFGVELPVRTLFEAPSVRDLAWRVEAALDAAHGGAASRSLPLIGRRVETGPPPLSFAQERLWFLDRLESGAVYNIPLAIAIHGALDVPLLAAALTAVARRHEALRTTFMEGAQVIAPPESAALPLPVVDLSALPAPARPIEARRRATEEAARRFDLAHGPLVRAALLQLGDLDRVLLLNLHHIIADGWSLGVLVEEMGALYRGGHGATLPELSLQYADFAVWQRRWLDETELAYQMRFWRARLATAPLSLTLPADRPRPAVQSFRGAARSCVLDVEVAAGLRALGQRSGATPFMTLLAGFAALLLRITGQDDMVIGTPIANRNRLETEKLIGFFVNSLALRQDLAGDPPLVALLARVREGALAAYAHQDLPFERLVEELRPERHLAHNPLFQVMFALQNAPVVPLAEIDLPGLALAPFPFAVPTAKFDLQLDLTETQTAAGQVLAGELRYATDLFDGTTMERMIGHYRTLLAAASGSAAGAELRLSDLPLLSAGEQHQLACEWPALDGRGAGDVRDARGRRVPIGVIGEIWVAEERTGDLARRLPDGRLDVLGRTGDPGMVRGFWVEPWQVERALLRHPDVREAVVAVQPASAGPAGEASGRLVAWVVRRAVLESAEPPTLADAAAEHVAAWRAIYDETWGRGGATDESFSGWISSYTGLPIPHPEMREWLDFTVERILALGGRRVLEVGCGAGLLAARLAPHLDLYRGVDFSAVALDRARRRLERARGCTIELIEGVADDWTGVGPGAFDLVVINSVTQYFPGADYLWRVLEAAVAAVAPGGAVFVGDVRSLPLLPSFHTSVELATVRAELSPAELQRRVARRGEDEEELVVDPAFFVVLAARLPAVQRVEIRPKRGRARNELTRFRFDVLLHVGGPTDEAPVVTWQDWATEGLSLDEIGKRLTEEAPPALAIAGIPDARLADLMAVGDGDAVEPEALVELGRRAGYAVELTWAAPEEWSSGRFAAIFTREGETVRTAKLPVSHGALTNAPLAGRIARRARAQAMAELRRFLRAELPEYMVPEAFVLLDALPVTPHGRIDRGALPMPARSEPKAAVYVAPRTAVEEALAEIWAELLDIAAGARVSTTDSFFALGGHSLLATQVVARLRERFGVELPLRALFEERTLADLAARVEAARRAMVGTEDGQSAVPLPPLESLAGAERPATFPASFSQRRLWFLDRLDPGTALYNIPAALAVHGDLDVSVLAGALTAIARRHEVLRTVFAEETDEPVQRVLAPAPVAVPVIDLTALPAGRRNEMARELAAAEAGAPFDLARGPLWRVRLLRLLPREHQALLTFHHIVSDGWSTEVLVREVAALYPAHAAGTAGTAGRPSPLPGLPLQYGDYAVWQRRWLAGPVRESQLAYWRRQLAGAPSLELPADRPRPAVETHRGALVRWVVPEPLGGSLRVLAHRSGATLFAALLAAFQALLARLSGQEDVSVGTPVAGRSHVEIEGLIGFFVNTLVLRVQLSGDPPFRELLARARETSLAAQAHQAVPFERLVEELAPERSLSRSPLFQVMLALQPAPRATLDLPGLTLAPLPPERPAGDTSKFDLTLTVEEGAGGLAAMFEYSTDLFDRTTIERWSGHLERLLAGAAAEPARRISELPLLAEAELHQLRVEGNSQEGSDSEATLYGLFAQQAEKTPEAWALEGVGERLTYGELRALAEQLAARLRGRGVAPEVVVAVCVERSPALVVGLLGTLAAGGVYMPIDPALPEMRRDLLLAESGALVLLTEADLTLDPSPIALPPDGRGVPPPPLLPGHLAYLIYTSGSSGQPKGVAVTHEAAVLQCAATIHSYGLTSEDRVLQFRSAGFDVSLEEILPTLAIGATVVMRGPDLPHPADLLSDLARRQITVANLPTAYWQQWVREMGGGGATDLPPLRLVIAGGEAMSPAAVPAWEALRREAFPGARLLNAYGPTETVITATLHPVVAADATGSAAVPTGRPMPSRSAYVVDPRGGLQPLGVPGELWLGGLLARGYLGDPVRTAERFVPDPFGAPGGRLYHTGDLVRRDPSGELSFLGRLDHQVKVRGFRVELGEIETALAAVPGVREAVVVASGEGEERRLAAFFVPDPGGSSGRGVTAAALRESLRDRLPAVLVPAVFVPLAALPLTPSGKVDRRALPDPFATDFAPAMGSAALRPRTPAEEVVAAIWCDVLDLPEVGLGDSFFDLGGHSLLAIRVASRLRAAFGVELPLRDLFERPTVEGHTARILRETQETGAARRPVPTIKPAPRGGALPLSFAQQRLWFLAQMEPGGVAYNIPFAVCLDGPLHVGLLLTVLGEIVRRHEALRTRFDPQGGEPVQVIDPPRSFSLPVVDLERVEKGQGRKGLQGQEEAGRLAAIVGLLPFDLARGPLLRAVLVRLGPARHMLLAAMHHIVSDEWSLRLLLREVVTLYNAFGSGRPSPLRELPVQYADYAAWQRHWLAGEALNEQLAFWRQRLGDEPPVLELPSDRPRPAVQSTRGDVVPLRLPDALAGALLLLSRRAAATPFMALLAGFAALLGRLTGRSDLAIGTPISGRTRLEVEELIGFFLNTLALRIDLADGVSFSSLVGQVRERSLAAYAHQDLPFEKLVDELRPRRSLAHSPLFQALFVLLHEAPLDEKVLGLRLTSVPAEQKTAKFDLSLAMAAEPGGALTGALEYASDLFDCTTIVRWAQHFERLLAGVVEDPDRPISLVPFSSPAEAHQILCEWNDTEIGEALTWPLPVHEHVVRMALRQPGATAIAWDTGSWSFGELDARAERLAWRLRAEGVGPDVPVGVLAERGPLLAVALLGVLKAGGAYLPLDPGYPRERLLFMIADAGARVIDLSTFAWDAAEVPPIPLPPVLPDTTAYVIYTSGSTGRPKGIALPHRTLSNLIGWQIDRLARDGVDPCLRTVQLASPSFDVSLQEVFATWCAGATLVVGSAEARRDPRLLTELLARERIERLFLPYVALQQLAEHLAGVGPDDPVPAALREVVTAGERLQITPQIAALFRRLPGCALHNHYGPSETHVVTAHSLGGDPGRWPLLPPIGRPLSGVTAYVLDRASQPVPLGVAGELALGGVSLARGYINRPDLTAASFIPDPFSGLAGARLYRSGDLARCRPDGEIVFLGRIDEQVKIRGYRIEPGEIEAALAAHPQVREAVVVARGDGTAAGRRLVAYITPAAGDVAIDELRPFLREHLPEHMLPAAFVVLPALPLTASGKVKRSALPEPDDSRASRVAHVPPATALERHVAAVVARHVGVARVGRDDNFFDAGAHSLLLVRVAADLSRLLARPVAVVDLFRFPTVSALARHLGDGGADAAPPDRAVFDRRAAERSRARKGRAALTPVPPIPNIVYDPPVHTSAAGELEPEQTFEQIAIIGMACRFPGAADPAALWRNLRDGIESITRLSDDELAAEGVPPALIADPAYVKACGVLDGPDLFDADFFGFTPREAELMDPQHRLFLECAWQACEDAGYVPQTYPGRIGVYGGSAAGTYFIHNVLTNPEVMATAGGMQVKLLNDKDFLTTHVSYKLNLRGPSVAIQTACSTSLVAVHIACQALLDGECDMALAGGTGVSFPHRTGSLYQEGGINSPDGHCRAFDVRAQGLVDGNGTGVVLLKRLSQAMADGDFIRAVVRGSAINNDGALKAGYTVPSVDSQMEVIGEALAAAQVDADTIGLVEAHGSGTPLGDPIEVQALTRAFRATTERRGFCALGSIKTNIGHTDAAAGVAGLIKAVLALEHRQLPPSLHFETPNPACSLPDSPFFVPTRALDWPAGSGVPRRAGVSSLGIGGTNAHVVLEEAPAASAAAPSRPWQLVVVSARSLPALDQAAAQLADHLARAPVSRFELADVAHTLRVGRKAFPHRRAVLCRDAAGAAAGLAEGSRRIDGTAPASRPRPVAFLFPGLGEHYAGMAAGLYRAEPVFRAAIDRSAEILAPHLGIDLRELLGYWEGGAPVFDRAPGGAAQPDLRRLLAEETNEEDAEDGLGRTAFAHPAVFAVEHALAEQWLAWGIRPRAMIGYSLGEYVAACLAGVFSLPDALALVAGRARLVDALPAGSMLAVPLPVGETGALIAGEAGLSLAAANGPGLSVVAGPADSISAFSLRLTAQGIASRRLRTRHAFHSPLMRPAAADLTRLAAGLRLQPPRIPFVSNLTGTWITDREATDPGYWAEHLCQPVQFASGLAALTAGGEEEAPLLLEVGPGQTLGTLARQRPGRLAGEIAVTSLRDRREEVSDQGVLLDALARLWVAGAEPDWGAFTTGERRRRVPLPTYPFERRRFFLVPGKASAGVAVRRGDERRPLGEWFYAETWDRPPAIRERGAAARERWLILGEGGGLAARLERILAADGGTVQRLPLPEDLRALFSKAREAGELPQRILHLRSLEGDQGGEADLGFYSLLALAQALSELAPESRVGLHVGVVTSGVADVLGEETLVPERATILGPCRVLPQEVPGVTCTVVDLAESDLRSAEKLAGLAERVIAELAPHPRPLSHLPPAQPRERGEPQDEARKDVPVLPYPKVPPSPGGGWVGDGRGAGGEGPLVALRGRRRFVRRFQPVELPPAEQGAARLRRGGVYLITGGLDETGVVLAEQLFRACGARLILLAPEDTPPMSRWGDWLGALDERSEESRRLRRILALERAGCELLVTAADLAHPGQVRQAVELAVACFGAIHGVVHAEGRAGAGLMQWKTRAQAAAVLAPKVRGTRVLAEALAGVPLDFCVLFGSNAGVTGGFGQADTAAGAAFLDAFAQAADNKDGKDDGRAPRFQAIDWGFFRWQPLAAPTPELAAALEQGLALYGIGADELFEVFLRVLASPLPHVVISTQDLAVVTAQLDSFSATALLDQIGRGAAPSHARPPLAVAYEPPVGAVEESLARVWQEAFGIDRVGRDDNFFELSGNSLLAIQIVTRISQALRVDLATASLLEAPTIAGLAEVIEQLRAGAPAPPEQTLAAADPDELERLLGQIEALSAAEAEAKLARELEARSG